MPEIKNLFTQVSLSNDERQILARLQNLTARSAGATDLVQIRVPENDAPARIFLERIRDEGILPSLRVGNPPSEGSEGTDTVYPVTMRIEDAQVFGCDLSKISLK